MFTIRIVPLATAANTAAVMKASVMSDMSISDTERSVCGVWGPVTVVVVAVRDTVQPMRLSSEENWASPAEQIKHTLVYSEMNFVDNDAIDYAIAS